MKALSAAIRKITIQFTRKSDDIQQKNSSRVKFSDFNSGFMSGKGALRRVYIASFQSWQDARKGDHGLKRANRLQSSIDSARVCYFDSG